MIKCLKFALIRRSANTVLCTCNPNSHRQAILRQGLAVFLSYAFRAPLRLAIAACRESPFAVVPDLVSLHELLKTYC